jgi:hypothetical protein
MSEFITDLIHGPATEPSGNSGSPAPNTSADPGENECLRCYLMRMMSVSGCDGTHRWTIRWRDAHAPRATGLLRKLARRGGICCDCEIIYNVWPDYPETGRLLPCAGMRADSTEPCDLRAEGRDLSLCPG